MNTIRFVPESVTRLGHHLEHRANIFFEQHGLNRYASPAAVGKTALFSLLFGASYAVLLLMTLPLGVFLLVWFTMGAFLMRAALSIVQDISRGILFSPRPWMRALLQRGNRPPPAPSPPESDSGSALGPGACQASDQPEEQACYSLVSIMPFSTGRAGRVYQHRYMRLLYPFFMFFWAVFDSYQYYESEKGGHVWVQHPVVRWVTVFVSKVYYLFYLLVVPAQALSVAFWWVALGFVCMHLGAGVVAVFAARANLAAEDPVFVVPNADGSLNFSWGKEQLCTTDARRPRLAHRELASEPELESEPMP
jgi:linoleoyl-CoA desaturase